MRATREMQANVLALSLAAMLVTSAGELPLKGSREIAFQTDAVTWLSLDVSPDGSTIVMEAVGDLYVLPIEGGAARRITSGMAFDSQPKFSPNGKRIAFVSDRDGSEDVWIANADGSELGNLSSNSGIIEFASPSWSPDGTHVVVSRTKWGLRTFELWAYHIDGGSGVQITEAKTGSDTPTSDRANALGAVYSPEGRYLYYARKDGGFDYDVRLPLWQIVRLDLRDGSEDTLTGAQGSAMRPVLSPDGSLLAYATRYRGGQRAQVARSPYRGRSLARIPGPSATTRSRDSPATCSRATPSRPTARRSSIPARAAFDASIRRRARSHPSHSRSMSNSPSARACIRPTAWGSVR